jgi:hypothetical protein
MQPIPVAQLAIQLVNSLHLQYYRPSNPRILSSSDGTSISLCSIFKEIYTPFVRGATIQTCAKLHASTIGHKYALLVYLGKSLLTST